MRPDGAVLGGANTAAVLTTEEAAAIARCGPSAIRSLIKRGLVPAIKVGPHYRIPRRPFVEFLERGDPSLVAQDDEGEAWR